jgi:predicted nucleic acid-binding protein
MTIAIVLDAGPLGLVTNPRGNEEAKACASWLDSLLAREVVVFVPEIADYEVRRELLRARKAEGLTRLDALKGALLYLPLTTATMLLAADYWATARQQGQPTAADAALDGDVILAAQANLLGRLGFSPIIATTNVKHLSLFVDAQDWRSIA